VQRWGAPPAAVSAAAITAALLPNNTGSGNHGEKVGVKGELRW
jgi:hypothetical protein